MMKPLLKWVGGKTSILDKVLEQFPSDMNDYHEPFIGGGSVLLGLLSSPNITIRGSVHAYDINPVLINFYKTIQSQSEDFLSLITTYQDEYAEIKEDAGLRTPDSLEQAKTSKESYYYWIRSRFNKSPKDTLESAILFFFLNKTCWRGVYRENKKGEFNVPFGNYKNPSFLDREHIRQVSTLIHDVIFLQSPFEQTLARPKPGDFVYLDPPYAPVKDNSFTAYTASGFSKEQHLNLFQLCKQLPCPFLMSNACVPLVTEAFAGHPIERVVCRRAINSKNPESTATEVLIR